MEHWLSPFDSGLQLVLGRYNSRNVSNAGVDHLIIIACVTVTVLYVYIIFNRITTNKLSQKNKSLPRNYLPLRYEGLPSIFRTYDYMHQQMIHPQSNVLTGQHRLLEHTSSNILTTIHAFERPTLVGDDSWCYLRTDISSTDGSKTAISSCDFRIGPEKTSLQSLQARLGASLAQQNSAGKHLTGFSLLSQEGHVEGKEHDVATPPTPTPTFTAHTGAHVSHASHLVHLQKRLNIREGVRQSIYFIEFAACSTQPQLTFAQARHSVRRYMLALLRVFSPAEIAGAHALGLGAGDMAHMAQCVETSLRGGHMSADTHVGASAVSAAPPTSTLANDHVAGQVYVSQASTSTTSSRGIGAERAAAAAAGDGPRLTAAVCARYADAYERCVFGAVLTSDAPERGYRDALRANNAVLGLGLGAGVLQRHALASASCGVGDYELCATLVLHIASCLNAKLVSTRGR